MAFMLKGLAGCTVAAGLLAGCAALRAQQASTPAPGADSKAAAPASKPKASTADDNPFPEEESKAAQKQAAAEDQADRQAAASGSAEQQGADHSNSSRDKLAGVDILGDHDSRIADGAGGTVRNPKLALEDLKVGQQYLGMGNYEGAYQRFKEACAVNPDNPDAVFFLAEAARKTAHLDESAENYKIYLVAEPDGARAKAAKKALAQLEGK